MNVWCSLIFKGRVRVRNVRPLGWMITWNISLMKFAVHGVHTNHRLYFRIDPHITHVLVLVLVLAKPSTLLFSILSQRTVIYLF